MPILVFLGLSVLDLGPMYATDRRQTSEKGLGAGHKNSLLRIAVRITSLIWWLVASHTFHAFKTFNQNSSIAVLVKPPLTDKPATAKT